MRSPSLRNRLLLGGFLVLVVALGLVGLALNAANHRGAVSALQGRMESYVYLLLGAMDVDGAGRAAITGDLVDPRLLQPDSGVYVYVRGQQDAWRSPSALGQPPPVVSAALTTGEWSFAEASAAGGFYALDYQVGWELDDGRIVPFTVSVRVDAVELDRQTSAFRLGLWRALVAAGLILAVAQFLLLAWMLRPLGRVAGDVARIESGRTRRLEGRYPRELEPLVRNVNRLLETEQSNQRRIRNALDSLAHSLKTPLAVIQAGLPLHGGEAGQSVQDALAQMQRLIATRLERAGASARRSLTAPVPVEPQVRRLLGTLEKVHSHRMISPEVKIEDGLAFYGEQRDLLELAGNLLDNAFKYGSSRVRVSGGVLQAERSRPGLWLRVEDDGPGIDEAQRERLLQRGTRGDERVEGHGLGLAIVTELVAAYGGSVEIGRSELGGARIDVEIPAM